MKDVDYEALDNCVVSGDAVVCGAAVTLSSAAVVCSGCSSIISKLVNVIFIPLSPKSKERGIPFLSNVME